MACCVVLAAVIAIGLAALRSVRGPVQDAAVAWRLDEREGP